MPTRKVNSLTNLSTTWQLFLAIAGVGLVLVVVSMLGLRLFFNHNFNAYLAAQEQQRLQELAVLVADFYDVQRQRDPAFELNQLGDLQRGGARRLLAGLSLAQWRDDVRSARQSGEERPTSMEGRLNFRNVQLLGADGERLSLGRDDINRDEAHDADAIRVPIVAGNPARTIGYLAAPRPVGPLQPIDTVFQQQQLSAIAIAAALAIVSAAIAAGWLASRLRRRVGVVASATRRLARGEYSTQVPVVGRDDLSALAEDVNQLAFSLQAASQQRRDFMADVAHELRTPLTILQAELEAMEDGIRAFDSQQMGLLQGQVRQLTQLVDDVHTLAQAEVGSLSYRWQPVNLTEWLAEQWASLQHQAETLGLATSLRLPNQPVVVRGDSERLTQLLHNLWSNSLRYTDVPGRIEVSLAVVENHVELVVEDSAPGVAEPHLEAIFTRLFRVESSRNRAQGGSGLGLALVKRIAAAHHGDVVAFTSALGGLGVRVQLPLGEGIAHD